MSDDDQTQPVRPGDPAGDPAASPPAGATRPPAPAATADETAAAEPVATSTGKRSFRDRFRRVGSDGSGRTFGLAALLASTLAALIVGGLGGAALHAAFDGDGGDRGDRGDRMSERHGPGERGDRHR